MQAEMLAESHVLLEDFKDLSLDKNVEQCAYCCIENKASLVQCLECKKWFCNSRGSTAAAHIISHLVYARHKQVMLNSEGPLGDTVLECYKCGSKNLFDLGFVAAKEESVVIILCRSPCANTPGRDDAWYGRDWQPLIEDKAILPWLVPIPKDEDLKMARKLSLVQIRSFETLWKRKKLLSKNGEGENPDPEALDERQLDHVVTVYDDAQHYSNVFLPLVYAEEEANLLLKEEQTLENVHIKWEMGLSQKLLATFGLVKSSYTEIKVNIGDAFDIKLPGTFLQDAWEGSGRVVRLPTLSNPEVSVEIMPGKDTTTAPTHISNGFTVSSVFNSVPFERMEAAINEFVKNDHSVSAYLYHMLLGHEVPPEILDGKPPKVSHAPNLPQLNHSQTHAVKFALMHPLSLIQGPPGTGKTVTSATLVYHLVQQFKKTKVEGTTKVLVVAPSNVAVDHLTEKISQTGLKVIRVPARSRSEISPEVADLSLESEVLKLSKKLQRNEFLTLAKLKEKYGELKPKDHKKYLTLKCKLEQTALKNAQVVCCTCTTAGLSLVRRTRFRALLIDEATQATEPECLIPLVTGVKQVIIVGDHQQLCPVIMSKAASKAGFGQSLFERLIVRGITPYRLRVQYRMHPAFSEFPSNMFYEGSLQNGVTAQERTRPDVAFPFPKPGIPFMFHCDFGPEELGSNGTSFLNRVEATTVEKCVSEFFRLGVPPEQIGIVTPYNEQRLFLMEHMCTNGSFDQDKYAAIQIESVDAFQGREKDYIILSCVRSNERQGIGFLKDPRRLNVAITRAKYGLIIVGNPRVLAQDSLWYSLIEDAQKRGVLVQGPLHQLKPVTEVFEKPKRHKERSSFSRKLEVEKRDALAHFNARNASKFVRNNGALYSRFSSNGKSESEHKDAQASICTQDGASQSSVDSSVIASNFSAHLYNQYGTQSSLASSQLDTYGSQSSFASFASQTFSDCDPYSQTEGSAIGSTKYSSDSDSDK